MFGGEAAAGGKGDKGCGDSGKMRVKGLNKNNKPWEKGRDCSNYRGDTSSQEKKMGLFFICIKIYLILILYI